MDDEHSDAGDARYGRETLWVFVTVLMVGFVLIGTADRLFNLGPSLGNVVFVALPLFAALMAASRQQHHD